MFGLGNSKEKSDEDMALDFERQLIREDRLNRLRSGSKKSLKKVAKPKKSRIIKNILKESKSIFRKTKLLKKLPRTGTGTLVLIK